MSFPPFARCPSCGGAFSRVFAARGVDCDLSMMRRSSIPRIGLALACSFRVCCWAPSGFAASFVSRLAMRVLRLLLLSIPAVDVDEDRLGEVLDRCQVVHVVWASSSGRLTGIAVCRMGEFVAGLPGRPVVPFGLRRCAAGEVSGCRVGIWSLRGIPSQARSLTSGGHESARQIAASSSCIDGVASKSPWFLAWPIRDEYPAPCAGGSVAWCARESWWGFNEPSWSGSGFGPSPDRT